MTAVEVTDADITQLDVHVIENAATLRLRIQRGTAVD